MVVATRDRPEMLEELLGRLAEQRLPCDRFEVVVVDDGSAHAPPDESARPDNLRIRVLRHSQSRGPAAARNSGWRAASAPFVAFTDDDCQPDAGWLDALLAEWGGDEHAVVQGRTLPVPAERHLIGPLSRTQRIGGPDLLFETCNIAYPRRLLERLGGFDEWFRYPCGEDVDLGWRATKAGARLAFSADALVYHPVHRLGLRGTLRLTWRWSDAVRVVAKHPETRKLLVAGVFWKATHPRLVAALAGAALAGWRRAPLLAAAGALPYLRLYARHYSSLPGLARGLPVHLVVDVCELASMTYGSVRHRTLML